MSTQNQSALVLAGGSAYGAFGVGVMKALFAGKSPATGYQPLEATIFSGSSVGAFNAAMMLCHSQESSLETSFRLERIWLERIGEGPGACRNGIFRVRGNLFSYLDADCLRQPALQASYLASDALALGRYAIGRAANFFASREELDARLIESINMASFIDSRPFHALLEEVIDEATIRQNSKHLTISATNWVTGRVHNFRNADFHDRQGALAVLASAAIPGIFPPVFIGHDQFVDGGASENTPLAPAIELGATELHVIDLNPPTQFIPISAQSNTLETMLRVYYVLLATKLQEDIASIAWINAGIRALGRLHKTGSLSDADETDFTRAGGHILSRSEKKYRIIRVHHYFPKAALGSGLSMMDFKVSSLKKIIKLGEHEAMNHDCAQDGCVF